MRTNLFKSLTDFLWVLKNKKIGLVNVFLIIVVIVLGFYFLNQKNRIEEPNQLKNLSFLFRVDAKDFKIGNDSVVWIKLKPFFERYGIILPDYEHINFQRDQDGWSLKDNDLNNLYLIKKKYSDLHVYQVTNEGLGVKDLIREVKEELYEFSKETSDKNEAALFEIKDFDLEINFIVQKRFSLKGGIEYNFITVDSESETSISHVQKIKLHLITIPSQEYEIHPSDSIINHPSDVIKTYDSLPPKKL